MTQPASITHTLRRAVIGLAVIAAGLGLATALDQWVQDNRWGPNAMNADWYRAQRILGYLPVWIVFAVAVALVDSGRLDQRGLRATWTRGPWIPLAAVIAGLSAEMLKLVIRRVRPQYTDGDYEFLPFFDHTWHTASFGMPSSHAAVAFAAACLVCHYWPRTRLVMIPVASGCAMTRAFDFGIPHYFSDVYGGAVVGWLSGLLTLRIARFWTPTDRTAS